MEEQFYLLWPVVIVVGGLLGVRRRWGLIITGAIIAVVWVWRIHLVLGGVPVTRLYNGADTRADAILVGCFAAQMRMNGAYQRRERDFLWYGVCVAGGVVGLIALGVPQSSRAIYLVLTPVDMGCALIVAAIAAGRAPLGLMRVLGSRLMVYIGKRSYSLYLWHSPIIFLLDPYIRFHRVGIVVLLCVSFVAAGLSYRFIEVPVLRVRGRIFGDRNKAMEPQVKSEKE